MQLIALGAGRGVRLRPHTDDRPKPLVRIRDGETILGGTLSNAGTRFDGIVVVTGYKAELLESHIASRGLSPEVRFEFNEEFDTKGPIVSLSRAISYMESDDFMIVNGDTYYDASVFREVDRITDDSITLLASRRRDPAADSMKVVTDGEDHVERVTKDLGPRSTDFVSAGAAVVRGEEERTLVVEAIERFVETEPNAYWHDVLNYVAREHGGVFVHEVDADGWVEIDTPEDLLAFRASV